MRDMAVLLLSSLKYPVDLGAERSPAHRASPQVIPAYRLGQCVKLPVLARLEAPSRRARLASDCNQILFRLHQIVLKTLPSQQFEAGRPGWLARAASRRPTSEKESPLAVASRASSLFAVRKNAAAVGSCTCARRGPVDIGLCERSATDQTECSKTSAGLSISFVRTFVTWAKYRYSRRGTKPYAGTDHSCRLISRTLVQARNETASCTRTSLRRSRSKASGRREVAA